MKSIFLFLLLLSGGLVPLSAQLPPGANGIDQQSDFLTIPTGDKFLRWYGHPGRTYFIQVSDANAPLVKWSWAPLMESGNDEPISYEVDGTPARGFFRLRYTDQVPGPGEILETADFDNDGLSNWMELTVSFTDPLNADSDGDQLDDAFEYYNGLDANDPSDSADPPGTPGNPGTPDAPPPNTDGSGPDDSLDASIHDSKID